MRVTDRLQQPKACFSFEFYPPKDDLALDALYRTVSELAQMDPGFVSVTYGAGGRTRARTVEITSKIKNVLGVEAAAHLTCVGHSRHELDEILDKLQADGIENLIALRGDPPPGLPFLPTPDGFNHASELIAYIRKRGHNFCIGAACYPEGHLESPSKDFDIAKLKEKVDAGADFLICQLFFDNAFYFDFVERARKAGITVPIIPGIMPVTSLEQLDRFTRLCGATVPMRLRLQLERRQDDPAAVQALGVAHATVQCMELLGRGARAIHFFTLNKSPATRLIVSALKGAY
ncbi:MAG TPA: methylenetetrahydrofolate reductase [NAD(P)H] [Myxococcales bacterium]|jgi:methylenetetrahydrofolate reductase (NADPH)